ncbi:MAG TPA: hypothetical protein VMW43_04205 [Bacteroidota bacterium]|nr:hypothetical protein [Bacteroidota bacterium]
MRIVLIIVAAVFFLSVPLYHSSDGEHRGDRKRARHMLDSITAHARQNSFGLEIVRYEFETAGNNHMAIAEIAGLMADVGHHTIPLIKVAQIAAETKYECKYFSEIASIVVRHLTESERVVDLARMARDARTPADISELERAIDSMEGECELKTIAEAKTYRP